MIYWSIKAAFDSEFIDRVVVSTEDEEIAEIAKIYSAEVPFLRPKEFATDESSGMDPVIHALEELPNVKEILLLQPTSPLRQSVHINDIFKFRRKFNANSAVSISLSKKPIIYKLNNKFQIKPTSEKIKPLPRQKLTNLYNLNGALYLSTRDSILQNKSFISNTTVGYIMPEQFSIDIDTQLDWDFAEYLMKKSL